MSVWPDPDRFVPAEPGPDLDGARFLAEAGAIMIGADNVGLEATPASLEESFQAVHTYLLAEAGVPILEVVRLDELAADRLYEFAFVGACMRIRGATGLRCDRSRSRCAAAEPTCPTAGRPTANYSAAARNSSMLVAQIAATWSSP